MADYRIDTTTEVPATIKCFRCDNSMDFRAKWSATWNGYGSHGDCKLQPEDLPPAILEDAQDEAIKLGCMFTNRMAEWQIYGALNEFDRQHDLSNEQRDALFSWVGQLHEKYITGKDL